MTSNGISWYRRDIVRMSGCINPTALAIHNISVRKVLYMTMVRSQVAYCCQDRHHNPLSPSQLNEFSDVLLNPSSLPCDTEISYRERLVTIGIIPMCHWHEYSDRLYVFKCIITNRDSNINIKKHVRETRKSTRGVFLNMYPSAKQWNKLPAVFKTPTKLWFRLKLV